MNENFDYYLLLDNNAGNTPLLKNDDTVDPRGCFYLSRSEKAAPGCVTHLTFRDPVVASPMMDTDYLNMDTSGVFSSKIYQALKDKEIKSLQLVPAIITGKKGETYDNFFLANVYQRIYSFDSEKTTFSRICKLTKAWIMIKSIVLDKQLLAQIPLQDRLVYVAKEHPSFVLYHKSVVDLIQSVQPKGLKCVKVEEWNNRIA